MFKVGRKVVGMDCSPFMIAELSANHGGCIERAKKSILAAKHSGASAVKIQTYTPDTMTLNVDKPDFKIDHGLWKGYSLYDLYEKAHLPLDWHKNLFEFAKRHGVMLFSTAFD